MHLNKFAYVIFTIITILISKAAFGETNNLAAFPGAQGFGIDSKGGRGGEVVRVTNLNDNGPGSLRSAVEKTGPRTVIFEISGRIKLKSRLTIENPYITIAGQTAPEPGIIITNNMISIITNDVVIQHLSIYPGDEDKESVSNLDCIQIVYDNAYNILIDHVTMLWGLDENLSIGYGAHDITVSNSIIAEALLSEHNKQGPAGYALLFADNSKRISFHNNIVASSQSRMPRIQSGSLHLANNLFYNKGSRSFSAIGTNDMEPLSLAAIGNCFKEGPSWNRPGRAFVELGDRLSKKTKIYLEDNIYNSGPILSGQYRVNSPPKHTIPSGFKLKRSSRVLGHVLSNAGARPNSRNETESRIINYIKTGGGKILKSQDEVGGYPKLDSNYRSLQIIDANQDKDKNGYSNIEEYLHSLSRALTN